MMHLFRRIRNRHVEGRATRPLQLLGDCICPALADTYNHLLSISLSDNRGIVIYYKFTIAFGWLHWYNIVGFQYDVGAV